MRCKHDGVNVNYSKSHMMSIITVVFANHPERVQEMYKPKTISLSDVLDIYQYISGRTLYSASVVLIEQLIGSL